MTTIEIHIPMTPFEISSLILMVISILVIWYLGTREK